MAQWTPVPVPPIPPEHLAGFEAHSVTMAHRPQDMMVRSYGWSALRNAPPEPAASAGPEAPATDATSRLQECEERAAALRRVWGGDAYCVFLDYGTVVNPNFDRGHRFAGFVCDDAAAVGATEYSIPVHRLTGGASTGRRFLLEAQAKLDAYVKAHELEAPYALASLGELAYIGYPPPGTDYADGNVLALWKRDDARQKVLALVGLRGFGRGFGRNSVGVFVEVEVKADRALDYKDMKTLADFGRDRFRYDILTPRIVAVCLPPREAKGDAEARPAPNASPATADPS